MDEQQLCRGSCRTPPFTLECGDRIRLFITDKDSKLGTLGRFEDDYYKVRLDTGERMEVQDASKIEKIMCKECWTRTQFPRFCQHIQDGFLELARLFDPHDCYHGMHFKLRNDSMAQDFGNALRHSSGVEGIHFGGDDLTSLSLQGVGALARGIAGNSTTLKKVTLFGFDNDEKYECLLRNLATGQTLEYLRLTCCFVPGPDVFRHLCRSSLTKLSLYGGSATAAATSITLEQDFSKFLSLRSVEIEDCQADVMRSCLVGLSTHPLLEEIKFIDKRVLFSTLFDQPLSHALERFVELQAKRDNLKSLTLSQSESLGLDFDTLCDFVTRLESLECLNLSMFNIGFAEAIRTRSLIQTSTRIRKLILPRYPPWILTIPEGMRGNKSLVELEVSVINLEPLLSALRGNTTLQTLILNHETSNQRHPVSNFEGLRSVEGLRRLDIEHLEAWEIDFESLVRGLKDNPCLIEIEGIYLAKSRDVREKIKSYLQRNRWFHEYGSRLLHSSEKVASAIWPYALAKVSSNVKNLYTMVNGFPGMVERKKVARDSDTSTR